MNAYLVEEKTGEIITETGKFRSDKSLEQIKEYYRIKELLEGKDLKIKEEFKSYGSFVWLLYNVNVILDLGIAPDELTKLIFISTYIGYDNKLIFENHTSMTKNGMKNLLNLSERKFYEFYKNMVDKNFFIEKDNEIFLDNSLFSKGKLEKCAITKDKMRLYVKGIRDIYNNSKSREHKLLSYFFQAIPFIGIQTNIICHNPYSLDISDCKPMTLIEFAEVLGYSKTNTFTLKNNLLKITIDDKPVFSMVTNNKGTRLFVNPKVYYAGFEWETVRILGEFC